ncbi:BTAD domain-containing putative transcriptional regulator [Streptomyces sp. NPDC002133]|uniref:BTAD domain-containing putative transcriptional regulator n=1 Tax=Streptomyces sp. NPDC002133 TaxID=3154409 RepID=UPI003323AA94
MHYRVLGTTQAVHDDGTPAVLGGARLRALVAVLALRAGRTVPVGVLVDEVWDGEPPADPVGAVQALVGRARRALGRSAVVSSDGGYRLGAGPEAVDLHRFERLAGEGARALAQGDPGRAAELLDEAFALWRGPVLADLPHRTADAARWEARRLDARRSRLAAALALGRAEETLPQLAALCGDHPLDEPLQALRIRALRAAGRTAEALAAYETVRRELSARLGTAPGPDLRALHAELLNPDEEPGPEPMAAGAPPAVGNLRARLTSFVGREADIEAIRGDLARARLVTLLGPGGAGKTRLSQEAAERAAGTYADGVWLVELAPVGDPENVPEAVLSALGARETVLRGAGAEELRAASDLHGDDPLVRLTEHCARRRMLIVLDNCEHVVAAAAALCEQILEHCPGLTVLATSREPLGVPGESVRPVDPLPDPMALRLLADRGAAANPSFRVEDDREAAAEICRRLDGLPLAIELAAARLRMLTPRQIADRLDDRFRLLTSGSRTVLPRQQTLRAVVDWSWDLLDDAERSVLRRLSVFARGCDLAAAERVCACPAGALDDTSAPAEATAPVEAGGSAGASGSVDAKDVVSVLGALVDKSLVVAAPSAGGAMRYRLLETVSEYASERLDEAGDRAEAEHAHLIHYRELARRTDPLLRGPEQISAVARLELEYDNLRTALRRAVAARDEQEALCLVLSLAWYWQMRDLRADARHWAQVAAALGPDPFAPPLAPAPPLDAPVTDTAPPLAPEPLQEARRGVRLIAMVSMEHGLDDWTTPERLEWLRGVTEVYRPGLPQTCRFPGTLWFFAIMLTGDGEQLLHVLDATVHGCEESGDAWALAAALHMRANLLANHAGRAGDASRDADRSLEIFDRLGDLWGAAGALSARGEARERRGEFRRAAEDYAAAIDRAERLGAQSQVPLLRTRLAGVLGELGRDEEAEAILRDVLAGAGEGTAREVVPAARLCLCMHLGRLGRTAEAREQLDLLAEDFRPADLAIFEGFWLGCVAWLDCLDGRYGDALDHAHQALESALTPLSLMVVPHMPAVHLVTAAEALAGLGREQAADAARLLGAYEHLLPAGHVALTSVERESRARAERVVRAALGDTEFAASRAEGGSLTLEEAAGLVRDRLDRLRTSSGTSVWRPEPSPR